MDTVNLPSGFETIEEARDRAADLINCLRNGRDADLLLANKLETCVNTPCGSLACPCCIRSARKNLIAWAPTIPLVAGPERKPFAVTLVVNEPWSRSDQLSALNMAMANRRFTRLLKKARVSFCKIGGIDISRNEEQGHRYWQLHIQLVIWSTDGNALSKRLRKYFPEGEQTPRPVQVQPVFDLGGAASYSLKGMFARRVSYTDDSGWRNTRKVCLSEPETRELATWLDQYGLSDRTIGLCFCPNCVPISLLDDIIELSL